MRAHGRHAGQRRQPDVYQSGGDGAAGFLPMALNQMLDLLQQRLGQP